ncbi:MAG: N-6 DNA methylase [Myxococcales bacterium]|nr:MAG: N-6 DNA methylase [Myxococcales bacterium]
MRMGFLDAVYTGLDYQNGVLLNTSDRPQPNQSAEQWLDKGEWLAAGRRAGAEKVFFVGNNPLILFSSCGGKPEEKIKAFNKAWSLARPRLLFLASPGKLTVYDLAQKPVQENARDKQPDLKWLATLNKVADVTEVLREYHRNQVESGRLFADKRFGDLKNRADKALIRDLKTVRAELIQAGLSKEKVRFAHALIGRSIFIRYLEDRGVLDRDYFYAIARQGKGWTDILESDPPALLATSGPRSRYARVLGDQEFTYALFRKLAKDFNGDMFPNVEEEREKVTQKHLRLTQDLLYGNAGIRGKLFFFAYRFDIIPLDLISAIYEEFYHPETKDDTKKKKARQDGAYYTPPVLAEFVLSRVLTEGVLKKNPRVLDPACGSGIFLVEAFRRIVRYRWKKKREALTFEELKAILKEQIAGIEVNEEAARIAAFSLYLSLLHYLEPPAISHLIKNGEKLPNLLVSNGRSENHYHSIWAGNSFDTDTIESNATLKEHFGQSCADVVVGNPPWGDPGTKADAETKERQGILLRWCEKNGKPIGDKEPSQAFLLRSVDFLKTKGKAGLLVSAGVLFKHSPTSQEFRKTWLDNAKIEEIFNFSHVRRLFFKEAISPFLAVFFTKQNRDDSLISYWSAKQVTQTSKNQAVIFSLYDRQFVKQDKTANSLIWKELWFGRDKDAKFIDYLAVYPRLFDFIDRGSSGRGFQVAARDKDAGLLKKFKQLSIGSFSRYGELEFEEVPDKIHRAGNVGIYDGHRLIIKRGVSESNGDQGKIHARLESTPFCFRHTFYGIKLQAPVEWKYKIILGILWSSLARYYFFMISSNWGLWHHEIHLDDELLQLPIVLDRDQSSTSEIIKYVDELRKYNPEPYSVMNLTGPTGEEIEQTRREWESKLDEAVFDLFGLNDEQRDLIHDFCEVTLPFYYQPIGGEASSEAVKGKNFCWIEKYAKIFCKRWNAYLDEGSELRACVHIGADGNLVAVEFTIDDKKTPWKLQSEKESWGGVLKKISKALPQPMGTSQILLDGLVHVVTNDGIIVVKRNEKRFWTRSLAREDADATLAKRMIDTRDAARESTDA